MYLSNLSLFNFKNYDELNLEMAEKLNCFVGNNGVGKTNLLDAIYYLSFCKSFFNPSDSQNIKDGQSHFSIQGNYLNDEKVDKVSCVLKKGQKKHFKRNKKEYDKLADHIGLIPLVMISPADSMLIIGGSELRRKFIDGIISQFDKNYLQHLINYGRALQQRNALLKQLSTSNSSVSTLEIWDDQLIEHGDEIHRSREKFIEDFTPLFQDYYQRISESRESVGLTHKGHLYDKPLTEWLKNSLQKDLQTQFTTTGIHKDDLEFTIGNKPLKKFASQGQQKSYLLALKLAQASYINTQLGHKPILLVDDIYDKLDKQRVHQLIHLLNEDDFGQLFITDTNPDHIGDIIKEINMKYSIFKVESGEVNKIDL